MADRNVSKESASFTDEYRLLKLRNDAKLVSIPDDPVETLRSAASEEFRSASIEELRETGLKVGHEQAGVEQNDE